MKRSIGWDEREFARVAAAQSIDLSACKHRDDVFLALASIHAPRDARRQAVKILDADHLGCIEPIQRRIGLSEVDAAEFRQRVHVMLFVGDPKPALITYRGLGSLRGWLRVLIARFAIDLKRAAQPGKNVHSDSDLAAVLPVIADEEFALSRAQLRTDLESNLQAALAELTPRERRMLRFRYVQGRSVSEIANVYGMHRVSVSRLLGATRRRLLDALCRAAAAENPVAGARPARVRRARAIPRGAEPRAHPRVRTRERLVLSKNG